MCAVYACVLCMHVCCLCMGCINSLKMVSPFANGVNL